MDLTNKPIHPIEKRVKHQKQQEKTKLGTGRYRKGLNLYCLSVDGDTATVERIEISEKRVVEWDNTKKPNKSRRECFIDDNKPHVWALNMANAKRKFAKYLINHIQNSGQ